MRTTASVPRPRAAPVRVARDGPECDRAECGDHRDGGDWVAGTNDTGAGTR